MDQRLTVITPTVSKGDDREVSALGGAAGVVLTIKASSAILDGWDNLVDGWFNHKEG